MHSTAGSRPRCVDQSCRCGMNGGIGGETRRDGAPDLMDRLSFPNPAGDARRNSPETASEKIDGGIGGTLCVWRRVRRCRGKSRQPLARRRATHPRQSLLAKIFHFPEFRICDIQPASRPLPKGRFAIVTRCGPGGGGRGSAGAACVMTGLATVSPQATRYDTARSQRSR